MSNPCPCPFPDLMKYVDPDDDSLAVPFVAGDFAIATNGHILACRPAAGWDGPVASPSVLHISGRIASAVWGLSDAAFRSMPTSADHIETHRCDACGGGTGVVATGACVVVLGATVAWKYAGLLMALGARVAVGGLDVLGHHPLCFAVGDLRGIVMPVRFSADTLKHLPVLMEVAP